MINWIQIIKLAKKLMIFDFLKHLILNIEYWILNRLRNVASNGEFKKEND